MLTTLFFVIGMSSLILFLSSFISSSSLFIHVNNFDRYSDIQKDLKMEMQNFSFSSSFYDFIKLTSSHVLIEKNNENDNDNDKQHMKINQQKNMQKELPTIKEKKNKHQQSNSFFPFSSSSSSTSTSSSQYPTPPSVTNVGFLVWSWSSIHTKNEFQIPSSPSTSTITQSSSYISNANSENKKTMPMVTESNLPPVEHVENQTQKENSNTIRDSFDVENVIRDFHILQNHINDLFVKQKHMKNYFLYHYKILLHCLVFVLMIFISFAIYFFSYFLFYQSYSNPNGSYQSFTFTSKHYNFHTTPANSLKCIDY